MSCDGHGHHHHHHHHEVPAKINTAFALAVLLNLLFTVIEAFYAYHAHSASLLADAGHNLGDVLGLGFAWFANWLLTRASSDNYSYGFKRTTILAAVVNALIIMFSSAIIAYEAVFKLLQPEAIRSNEVMLVALIGIVINAATAMLFHSSKDSDLNVKAAFLHLMYDALVSLGVVVVGAVIHFTGWLRLDPIAGLCIVLFIIRGTWSLLRESIDMMLDAVPKDIDIAAVKDYLLSIDGVTAIHDVHVWGLSTRETALTAHLVMPKGRLSDELLIEINQKLNALFKISHATLQTEKGALPDPCGQHHSCE
jgi:cobalt-zinc-cadmium efflux system protein